ncbi:sugar transferase [Candidatus Poribacteria bacterium]|jgi:lipopolysaccharide/colanic/teichoic acid biosynthesis glycosyltransferase|nr:sugar transferase [Candidatus Poribacteria bacterium]MBT5711907.1 sugar transferase [Candidatus Poribacteria bacterium]MBT7099149.1 sugar transferase [Candidatus Poribacteria bacterium]MBT7807317.1 sugar transferase [Candidatus Poribacteria bacterium]
MDVAAGQLEAQVARLWEEYENLPGEDQVRYIEERLPDRSLRSTLTAAAKRALDIVAASGGLVVALPLAPLVILAIRLDSKGPAFFSQVRIGKNGRSFVIYKLRTLSSDSPAYTITPTRDEDYRLTRVGRTLRRLGLDELPQLWNVLRGEMSLVGPRPEMPFLVDTYSPLQRLRLRAKPGITGMWQISPYRNEPIHHHVEYDLHYLLHPSLLLDLRIALRTFGVLSRTKPGRG